MKFSTALKYACSVALVIAAGVPVEARTSFPAQGGTGKHAPTIECGDNEYLIGFAGRVGSWIDRVQPLCATVLPDGRRGPINDKIRSVGGNGGSPAEFNCPSDSFVSAVTITLTPHSGQVAIIDFTCYRPVDGQYLPDKISFAGTRSGVSLATETCPDGEIGTGLNIRYGEHVNAIGLICDTLVIPKAAASAKPAKPASSGPAAVSTLTFAGAWETTTSSNARFTVSLTPVIAQTPMPGAMLQFIGVFVNKDGAHQYDGQLQGTAQYPSAVMTFTYQQPGIDAAGTGVFTLSGDGKSFTGSGLHMQNEAFAWNGARNKAPPVPAAPAGAAGSVDDNTPMGTTGGKNGGGVDDNTPMGTGGKNGAPPQAVSPMEQGIDRPGNDYSQTVKDDPETCQAECLTDGKCVAWTWVQPGVQGPNPQCYLKDRVPPARPGDCCTSGVK